MEYENKNKPLLLKTNIELDNFISGIDNKLDDEEKEPEFNEHNRKNLKKNIQKLKSLVSMDDYFEFILPKIKVRELIRNPIDNILISYYINYLKQFCKILRKYYQENTEEQILRITNKLNYIYYPKNRLIFQFGDIGKTFFIILKGSIDILVPKQKIELLSIFEYYRYLAILIGYNEKELFIQTLNSNAEIYPLEIEDFISYGKIIIPISNSSRRKITKIQLKILFYYLTKQEREQIEEGKFIKFDRHGNIKFLHNNFDTFENENIESDFDDKRKSMINLSKSKRISTINKKKFEKQLTKKGIKTSEFILEIKNEFDDNVNLSTENYIERLNMYKINNNKNFKEKREINFIIYYYEHIKTLYTGEKFGDYASYEIGNKRTATIITSSNCHLATLSKKYFLRYVKTALDKNKNDYLNYILSTFIFNDTNIGYLHDKLFHHFVIDKVKKGENVLNKNNDLINHLIFLKKGLYEIKMKLSLKDILIVIKYYLKKLELLFIQKKITWSTLLEKKIYKNLFDVYSKIKKENQQVENFAKEIEQVNILYNQKFEIILWLSSSNEILGFDDLNYENKINLFSIKCISDKSEFIFLDKEIYKKFFEIESEIKKKEYEYVKMKLMRLIHRLIEIRHIKITTFSEHNISIGNFINIEKEEKDFNKYFENNLGEKASNHRKLNSKNIFNKLSSFVIDTQNKKKDLFTIKARRISRNIFTSRYSKRNLSNSKENISSNFNEFIHQIQFKKSHSTLFRNNKTNINNYNNNNNSQKKGIIIFQKVSVSSIDNITKDETIEINDKNKKSNIKNLIDEKQNKNNNLSNESNIIKLNNFSQKNIFHNSNKELFMKIKRNIESISKSLEMKDTFKRISDKIHKKKFMINPIEFRETKKNNYLNFRNNYNIQNTRDAFLRFKPILNLRITKKNDK